MSLKLKILGTVLIIAVFGLIAELAIFDRIVFDGFLQLEREQATRNMGRIRNAIRNELNHLDATLHNESSSDPLYRFAGGREGAASAFFSWEALRAARLNLAAMFDASGRLVECGAFDLDAREQLKLKLCRKDLAKTPNPVFPIAETPGPSVLAVPVNGLLMTEAGPMLIAARRIFNGQGWGPSRGILVMGRLLNANLIDALRNELHLDFTVSPAPEAGKPGSAITSLDMTPVNDDILEVASVYPDIFGAPGLTLTMKSPRGITLLGRRLLRYVAWALLVLSAMMVLGLFFLMQRIVIGPLSQFARHVSGLGENLESGDPFPLERKDEIGAVVKTVNDLLAARRMAAFRLKENQALLRSMLTGIPLDFWAMDREMRCIMQSNISVRHWGEKAGSPFTPNLASKDALADWNRNIALVLSGETASQEFTAATADGQKRIFHETAAPIMDEGRILGILGVNIDATEDKRREEALRKAIKKAEVANRSKSEFLANMSHEIRTPLNSVLGMLQLAGMTELDKFQRGYIDTALASGRSLLAVIGDILDLSKIEAGKIELEEQAFDLNEMLAVLRAAFEPQAARKGLRLDVSIAPDAPTAIRADSGRLRQILFNLIGNALKFTDQGGVAVSVAAQAAPGDENAFRFRFAVKDTGLGVSPEKLTEIFEPFVQADGSYRRNRSGSGLGLAIVKRLTELMGGTITVDSSPGKGSLFACEIPARAASDAEIAMLERKTPSRGASSPQRLKVLLVEDEEVNRLMALSMLEKLGHAPKAVKNGRESLDILAREEFDCVLMDVQMPELDGLETTRLIRKNDALGEQKHIPIIALTAHAMKGDRERCLRAGMDAYLSKPLEAEDLKDALARIRPRREAAP